MSALRPSSPRLRHRIAAAAATLTLTGGLVATGAASAQALPWRPGASGTGTSGTSTSRNTVGASTPIRSGSASPRFAWARTVTGREVRVARPTSTATPIHLEKITHPSRDFAGSLVAEHFHGAPVSRSAAQASANSVPALPGIDVSAYQGNINWGGIAKYLDFAYAKATEGTYYTNPDFYNQYVGPYNQHLIRGAYHFAIPSGDSSSTAKAGGTAQADYFIHHGGGWSSDGRTLPGALDIEYNPYGQECYNMSKSNMVMWLRGFVNEYAYREHVFPVIYTTTDWWRTCTGNYGQYFGSRDPLWIANYTDSHGGPLPNAWGFYTFWQYRASGSLPGDQDVFNGPHSELEKIAKG